MELPMKTHLILAAALLSPLLPAQPLSESDRDQVLEKLDSFKEEAGKKANTRLGDAATALKKAVQSENASTDLYLKCKEQVDFLDAKRTTNDFRNWKRASKDWLESDGFGAAAQNQIRWLMLSLKASAEPSKADKLGPEALECLESIFREPAPLARHTGMLATPMRDTVFARTYGIRGDKIEAWPSSPIQKRDKQVLIEETFEKAIFPGYRESKNFKGLRDAWDRRIHFEEVIAGFWTGDDRQEDKHMEELAKEGNHPNRAEFLREREPDLKWQKEMDLFQSGDQKAAVLNLLAHLEENLTHSKARDWEAQLRGALQPMEAGAN